MARDAFKLSTIDDMAIGCFRWNVRKVRNLNKEAIFD
jgi:hypothetical protein